MSSEITNTILKYICMTEKYIPLENRLLNFSIQIDNNVYTIRFINDDSTIFCEGYNKYDIFKNKFYDNDEIIATIYYSLYNDNYFISLHNEYKEEVKECN